MAIAEAPDSFPESLNSYEFILYTPQMNFDWIDQCSDQCSFLRFLILLYRFDGYNPWFQTAAECQFHFETRRFM